MIKRWTLPRVVSSGSLFLVSFSASFFGELAMGCRLSKKGRKGPMIFIISPGYLLYISDIYYISRISIIYPRYLLYIPDICHISNIFIIYPGYLVKNP